MITKTNIMLSSCLQMWKYGLLIPHSNIRQNWLNIDFLILEILYHLKVFNPLLTPQSLITRIPTFFFPQDLSMLSWCSVEETVSLLSGLVSATSTSSVEILTPCISRLKHAQCRENLWRI